MDTSNIRPMPGMQRPMMPIREKENVLPPEAAVARAPVIGEEQVKEFTQILQKYKTGKTKTEQRIVASENWWKLRNRMEEQKTSQIGKDGGFVSRSGWLHNVIVSKHADAVEAYPEPNILPREYNDRAEAVKLSAIVPCVLEQNDFEDTYSDVMWQKLKTGTGVYKIVWDKSKLNGLGDIAIERVNLLNIYWEPGVTDIQRSRYFFHTELMDKDILEQMYPKELKDKLKGQGFVSTKFLYDDHVDTENKATVIEVYYHKHVNGKKVLHYCKYVDGIVLYATENDTQPVIDRMSGAVMKLPMSETGLYDHGKYPYIFDALYPIEGSPCGYGFVDLCANPQTVIDLLNTSFVKNAVAGATPRYFARGDGSVNEAEFLDTSNAIVHVTGNLGEDSLRRVETNSLDGIYVNFLDRVIQELRETSGNTETSTGSAASGVTAASAIAALQEASGKGSRDSTRTSYRAYSNLVDLCIELIRQFYDLPRQFRITGQMGEQQFISYTNAGIRPQSQGNAFGMDMGLRLPVFDIKVSAQKKNVYTKITQNELAMQFFQLGFFNPQMSDQALMCIELMDFDGKDTVMQKISQNETIMQKLIQYMQMALLFSKVARPEMTDGIARDIMQTVGGGAAAPMGAVPAKGAAMPESDNIAGLKPEEYGRVTNARARANEASQPGGSGVLSEEDGK